MRLGFITGSVRTGTTLLSRIVGDHPDIIGYREMMLARLVNASEVNRHVRNAGFAGFSDDEIRLLGSNIQLFDYDSIERWLLAAAPMSEKKWGKKASVVVEKDPGFFLDSRIIPWAMRFPLIHTVRHPYGLLDNSKSPEEDDRLRDWRKRSLFEAVQVFNNIEPYINHDNLLIIRYEDLVTDCDNTMRKIFTHLGLRYSDSYKEEHNSDDRQYGKASKPKALETVDPYRAWSWLSRPDTLAVSEVAEHIGMKKINEYAERFSYTI